MNDFESILNHALASQYLGQSFIFLESGSGAKKHATPNMIKFLIPHLKIPIIVGGGVNTAKSAQTLVESGAGYIVSGSNIESLPSLSNLNAFTNAIHIFN